jgi:N-acetyl-1-D-myo-inositol-2-amino-2-deoxy-alpha-D-glucopyranoside deacetylase
MISFATIMSGASASRRLVLVHAHPDDECLSTGGTIARYAYEGVHVCLITCTNGEVGEVADLPELGDAEAVRARLGDIRREELIEACRRLGDVDLRMLGYHDSGMQGTPENDSPHAFVNQDLAGPIARIASILREIRPQVLVTYNEYGFYGHPDHIRAHEAALAATDAAADEQYEHAPGTPHRVAKVYYTAVPKSMLRGGRSLAAQMGESADDFFSVQEIERIGTDDDRITTWLDVSAYVDKKFEALEAHRTQLGTTGRFLQIPEAVRAAAMGTEHYILVRSEAPAPEGAEHDLFQGVTD